MRVRAMGADTLGAARKAGLHLACGHDDKALAPTDCILSNVGVQSHRLSLSPSAGGILTAVSLRNG